MKDADINLKIGDLKLDVPIIQGGMGVQVSNHSLVSAVSNSGALGIIASVGLGEDGYDEKFKKLSYEERSKLALRNQIIKTRKKTKNPFGVNIMCALNNYKDLVHVCVENNVDVITSGAGLPLNLPSLVGKSSVKLVPIVSSSRAMRLIVSTWHRKYNIFPDAIVIEGPLAGGHLGFPIEELKENKNNLKKILKEMLKEINEIGKDIPLIVAGGIWDGKDIAKFLRLGAKGVQMATRFVATEECDVSMAFKEAYINASKNDVVIIDSPVGLPGRVLKNELVNKILNKERMEFDCKYKCLRTCDPTQVKFCIADALLKAKNGDMSRGFVMCGSNVYKVKEILKVDELISKLISELKETFKKKECINCG